MANIFTVIGDDADDARRKVERLNGVMPGPAQFPAGGGGGVPASLIHDIATIKAEQRRIRTALESPDPLLGPTFAGG